MNEKNYLEKLQKEYYVSSAPTKMDKLRALDKKVKRGPAIFAYVFGIVAALIFGVGMCLAMQVIGGTTAWMVIGIIAGIIGISLMLATYPLYKKMLAANKQEYSSEIFKMSNELLNEEAKSNDKD